MKKRYEKIVGIILAGGLSKRMGKLKPLLPVPRVSALGVAVSRMRSAGIGEIIAVAGHSKGKIVREAGRFKCSSVYNPDYESGMFSSVVAGVKAMPPHTEAVFVQPGDIPLVKPATYRILMNAFHESYGNPRDVYPTFRGERAHPPLIGRAMTEDLLSWCRDGGLRGVLYG